MLQKTSTGEYSVQYYCGSCRVCLHMFVAAAQPKLSKTSETMNTEKGTENACNIR